MSDFFEHIVDETATNHKVCRVAYTLNNMQPVLCSIIGDEPLFYMDFEEEIIEDDDGFFNVAVDDFLDREIQILRDEIKGFEHSRLFSENTATQRDEEFVENFDSMIDEKTKKESFYALQEQKEKIIRDIRKSRLADTYLNFAQEHDINIVISRQVEKAFYDRRNGTILLNPDIEMPEQMILMARELRRHWQYRQGVLINPLMFQPEHAILVARAQEADLTISMIRIAWELQLAGIYDTWERIESSPMGDLARAFAREAFMDFRTINNGEASAAIFEAWFLSERCRQRDKNLIQAMLADYNGYVFDNFQSSKSVTAELISGLGSMPYGKNYLSVHAMTIMNDPIFTEVRDRSNANFLWFIKFERSFKETEQELQSQSDLSTRDIRHDLLNAKSQDIGHEYQQAAQVIHLFAEGRQRPSAGDFRGDADIIDFRLWSGR